MTERKVEQEAIDTINAYKKVFNSEEGKRVIFDLMNRTGFFSNQLLSSEEIIYKEGQRSIITQITGLIGVDSQKLLNIYTQKKSDSDDYYDEF